MTTTPGAEKAQPELPPLPQRYAGPETGHVAIRRDEDLLAWGRKIQLAALSSVPAAVPGWQLVPVEPTEEMREAAHYAPRYGHPETAVPTSEAIYRAMLSAAPHPPAAEAVQAEGVSVPEGWALVPIEPTEEMGLTYLKAAELHAADGAKDKMRFSWGGYRAMLAAAPKPPAQPEVSPELSAWRERFPAYVYRPQDDCVTLRLLGNERHPDTLRCIEARNRLNDALHGEGAVIDELETAVASICSKLKAYRVKAYLAAAQPDQGSLSLCNTCGWRGVVPTGECLVCAWQKAAQPEPAGQGLTAAQRWQAVEHGSSEMTLRIHNSRPDQRAAVVDAYLAATPPAPASPTDASTPLGASPSGTALSAPAADAASASIAGADLWSIDQLRSDAIDALGAPWAAMLEDGTLASCYADATDHFVALSAEDVAIARAAIHVVTGSALLGGERKAISDAPTLYGLLCRANNLLIGTPVLSARGQARSATTEGRGPKDAEPGAEGTRPEAGAASQPAGEVLKTAAVLEAMARNYANGHQWDRLDGEAVTKAAKMLRALATPTALVEPQAPSVLANQRLGIPACGGPLCSASDHRPLCREAEQKKGD